MGWQMYKLFVINQNKIEILPKLPLKLFLMLVNLAFQGINTLINGFLKSLALLFGKQLSTGQNHFDLGDLIPQLVIGIQTKYNFTGNDVVIKVDKFVHLLVDEIKQFLVCSKMN